MSAAQSKAARRKIKLDPRYAKQRRRAAAYIKTRASKAKG